VQSTQGKEEKKGKTPLIIKGTTKSRQKGGGFEKRTTVLAVGGGGVGELNFKKKVKGTETQQGGRGKDGSKGPGKD